MTQYIFDLYGTLLDIHTDETIPDLYRKMAGVYAAYGALYSPEQLKEAYFRTVREEEQKRTEPWPEIELREVFLRLLDEAGECCAPCMQADRKTFAEIAATIFRILSRQWLRVYPGTVHTLRTLKEQGNGIWLLSNAQSVFTVPELVQTGLYDLFDGIFISSDHGIKKPDPAFLDKLIRTYGLERDACVMIGNEFRSDIAVAEGCGIRSILLNTDGYSPERIEQELRGLRRTTCTVIGSVTELLKE